jgi:hypothetical protein
MRAILTQEAHKLQSFIQAEHPTLLMLNGYSHYLQKAPGILVRVRIDNAIGSFLPPTKATHLGSYGPEGSGQCFKDGLWNGYHRNSSI